jgi:hypothetical protein
MRRRTPHPPLHGLRDLDLAHHDELASAVDSVVTVQPAAAVVQTRRHGAGDAAFVLGVSGLACPRWRHQEAQHPRAWQARVAPGPSACAWRAVLRGRLPSRQGSRAGLELGERGCVPVRSGPLRRSRGDCVRLGWVPVPAWDRMELPAAYLFVDRSDQLQRARPPLTSQISRDLLAHMTPTASMKRAAVYLRVTRPSSTSAQRSSSSRALGASSRSSTKRSAPRRRSAGCSSG